MDITRSKFSRPETLIKYSRSGRLSISPIFPGLHHQFYPNKFVNSSLAWDCLQVTLKELGRMMMAIFMKFYSKMVILKNGAKTNIIIMLTMHAYPSATSYLGL